MNHKALSKNHKFIENTDSQISRSNYQNATLKATPYFHSNQTSTRGKTMESSVVLDVPKAIDCSLNIRDMSILKSYNTDVNEYQDVSARSHISSGTKALKSKRSSNNQNQSTLNSAKRSHQSFDMMDIKASMMQQQLAYVQNQGQSGMTIDQNNTINLGTINSDFMVISNG